MNTKTMPPWIIHTFFYLGMVSALLFRSTIVVNHFNPLLGRMFWYIAVSGYIFFFGYRFYIAKKRRSVILKQELQEKVKQCDLSPQNKESINYLLSSIVKSKEMLNYIVIFILSLMAIVVDIVLTISKSY